MKIQEKERRIEELSKKEHLTEEEKSFVRKYYRSMFLGSLSLCSEGKIAVIQNNSDFIVPDEEDK